MSLLKSILIIIVLTTILSGCATLQTSKSGIDNSTITNQNKNDSFKSVDGFKIDLPKSVSSVKDASFDSGYVKGYGKSYVWENTQDYSYMVSFYDLDNGKVSLTEYDKTDFLKAYKDSILDPLKSNNLPFTEKKYVFNGNEGVEIQATNPKGNSKMVARFFTVNKRFYFIGLTYNPKTIEDSEIYQIADSFALIDSESKSK